MANTRLPDDSLSPAYAYSYRRRCSGSAVRLLSAPPLLLYPVQCIGIRYIHRFGGCSAVSFISNSGNGQMGTAVLVYAQERAPPRCRSAINTITSRSRGRCMMMNTEDACFQQGYRHELRGSGLELEYLLLENKNRHERG